MGSGCIALVNGISDAPNHGIDHLNPGVTDGGLKCDGGIINKRIRTVANDLVDNFIIRPRSCMD